MDRLRNISRDICSIRGIKISLTVILIPDDKNPIKVYKRQANTTSCDVYMYLDYPAYVSIRFPAEYGTRNNVLIVSIGTQQAFIDALKEMIEVFDRNDIFYLQGSILCMYPTPNDAIITKKIGEHYIELRPTIVEDITNNTTYEGAELHLDRESIVVQLTYRELKALCRVVDRIDIPVLSQLLINYVGNKLEYLNPEERKMRDEVINKLDTLQNVDIMNKTKERPVVDDGEKRRAAVEERKRQALIERQQREDREQREREE